MSVQELKERYVYAVSRLLPHYPYRGCNGSPFRTGFPALPE